MDWDRKKRKAKSSEWVHHRTWKRILHAELCLFAVIAQLGRMDLRKFRTRKILIHVFMNDTIINSFSKFQISHQGYHSQTQAPEIFPSFKFLLCEVYNQPTLIGPASQKRAIQESSPILARIVNIVELESLVVLRFLDSYRQIRCYGKFSIVHQS